MTSLRNTTRGALTAGDVTFPAGGTADLPEGFEARVKGDKVFAAWLDMKWLVLADDEAASELETDPDALTAPTSANLSDPAEPTEREAIIAGIIRGLPVDDAHYTKAGKPEVDAINAALPSGEPVTAAERDAVWKAMQEA